MTLRVGFLTTHPIQYQVPVLRLLAKEAGWDFTVFYCQIPDAKMQGAEFNVPFVWDLPLLDGYRYRVLTNISKSAGVMTFSGCDTPEIYDVVRREKFDAFIVNGWVVKSCLQALWACRKFGVPCLARGDSNDLRPRSWWKRWIQSRLVRQYSGCLATGKANAAFYRNRGIAEDRIFSSPHCVENQRFAEADSPLRRAKGRQRWGIPREGVCFLFSGKLIEKKHPLELLIAFRDCQTPLGTTLLIVGDGPLREQCEAFAKEHRLRVVFAGFLNQSEMIDGYAAADCLVLPSDAGETWGLVANEAMAAGRPVIASSLVGCVADLVTPAETGAIFSFGDWSELSRLLRYYAENMGELRIQGIAARKRITNYSPEVAAEGIAEAVRSVVAK